MLSFLLTLISKRSNLEVEKKYKTKRKKGVLMSKTKAVDQREIRIKGELPIILMVKEIINRSVAVGANSICFLPEKNCFSIFCSNGKKVIPIKVLVLEKRGGSMFFAMVSRLKVMLGMRISDRKNSQIGSFKQTFNLPAFNAITTPTEFGESILINFS